VIAPGETSATIAVSVIGNAVYQTNRNFDVQLSNVINQAANILDGAGNGVIVDDDLHQRPRLLTLIPFRPPTA
jgi:hypothetical protein